MGLKYRIKFVLEVKEAANREQAVERAIDYFCGGDYYTVVDQVATEVEEIPDEAISKSEAAKA